MSKTDSLHYQLCLEGAKWLHRKKKTQYGAGRLMNGCLWAFKYVAVEINTVAAENPDVWGYDDLPHIVISGPKHDFWWFLKTSKDEDKFSHKRFQITKNTHDFCG